MSDTWLFHCETIFDGHTVLEAGHAVAVQAGHILSVGPEAQVSNQLPTPTHDVNLAGRTLSLGFIDAHVHTLMGGVQSLTRDLTGAYGIAQTLKIISTYAQQTDAPWITGGGWSMSDFPCGAPSAAMLDAELFTIDATNLHAVGVELTLTAGRIVYDAATTRV